MEAVSAERPETKTELLVKYCECGCGGRTRLANQTRTDRGWVKGEPLKYISGHQGRSKLTREQREQKQAEHKRAWRERNPEYGKQYYEANKVAILQKQAVRNADRALELQEYFRRYYIQHRDKKKLASKRWAEQNPERLAERGRNHRDRNRERLSSYYKTWRSANQDRRNALEHKRAARAKAGGSYTVEEWLALKIRFGNKCLRCLKPEKEVKLTVDHVIPLSKGGRNDITNLQPLCFICNTKKRAKTIDYRVMYEESA